MGIKNDTAKNAGSGKKGDLAQWLESYHKPAKHYENSQDAPQPIDLIDAYDLDFCLGNVIKYVCRAGNKPGEDAASDLLKARWYLERKIVSLYAKNKR